MTKSLVFATALLLALAAPATAHGAAEARSIDQRLLADDDGFVPSIDGGISFVAGQAGADHPGPVTGHEGHDLLSLDVRSAYLGDAPAIWFRLAYQAEGALQSATDISDHIHLTISGTAHTFSITSNYTEILAHDLDAAFGPYEIQDGFPRALDLVLRYDTLGIAPGDEITGIYVESHKGDDTTEMMPGTYYKQGNEVEWVGDPTHMPSEEPAAWTTPAATTWLALGEPQVNGTTAEVTVTSLVGEWPQEVALTLDGAALALDTDLSGNFSKRLEIPLPEGAVGALLLEATSDMGGYASAIIDIPAPEPPVEAAPNDPSPTPEQPTAESQDTPALEDPPVEPALDDAEAPGAPLAMLLLGIAAIAIVRRR